MGLTFAAIGPACPECKQGKHHNCTHEAINTRDAIVACTCMRLAHLIDVPEVQRLQVDEAIDMVAHRVIADAATGTPPEWDNYPDIGEEDWHAVQRRVHQIVDKMFPTNPQYASAYALLESRAEQ